MTNANSIASVVLILYCVASAACLAGCGDKDSADAYAVSREAADVDSDTAPDPIIFSFGTTQTDYIMDPYTIENASIVEDILHLEVSYTGGCQEHLFELVALNDFLASQPVQADILLTHDANNDSCESPIKEELQFSLLSIKEEYKIVFQTETGTLTLKIQDATRADGYIAVEYTF